MRRFISTLFTYSGMALVFCYVVSCLIYGIGDNSYYEHYERDEIVLKSRHLRNHIENYNTLFIGSSRIYRHVNPVLFDSLTITETHSFNLAYSGLFPYRAFDVLDEALADNPSVEHVFIELHPLGFSGQNYDKPPSTHSINHTRYVSILKLALFSDISLKDRLLYTLDYTLQYFYKYLGFGISEYVKLSVKFPLEPPGNGSFYKSLAINKGFTPLDESRETAQLRRQSFLKDISVLDQYKQYYHNQDVTSYPANEYTRYHLAYADKLRERGLSVFFVIAPRHDQTDYLFLNNLKKYLGAYPILDLSSPEKYGNLYREEYSFDRVHLNEKGSRFFTQYLASYFNENR